MDGSVAVPGTSFSIASRGIEKDWWCAASGVEGEEEERGENRAMFFGARPTSFYRGGKCGALQQKKENCGPGWLLSSVS